MRKEAAIKIMQIDYSGDCIFLFVVLHYKCNSFFILFKSGKYTLWKVKTVRLLLNA